jgi:simple sugar transport system permease protein
VQRTGWLDLLATLITIGLALLAGFLVLVLAGRDAIAAYTALLTGPLTRLGRFGQWLEVTSNLIFVGLAASIAFRARLFNLGLQAQVLMGAAFGYIAASYVAWPPVIAVLAPIAAAMLGGFLLGVLPGLMKAHLNASEVLTTLMLNFITPLALGLLFDVLPRRFRDIPQASWLPRLSEVTSLQTSTLHAGVFIAILAVIAAWLLIDRTPLGYAIRMTGANRRFARYGGIDTARTITLAFGISGAFAALAGANVMMGVLRDPGISVASFTFDGLVVALLARNRPLAVPLAALFYAYLLVGADRMEQAASVGAELVRVIQAVIVLLVAAPVVLAWFRRRAGRDPSAVVTNP